MNKKQEQRKKLAVDRLLILEYFYSEQEGMPKLIEECKAKLNSNDSEAIEDCIDALYEQFEQYFSNGQLLSNMSDLIKKYKIATLTPKDFIYDGARVRWSDPDGRTGTGTIEARDDMNDEYEVVEDNGQNNGIFSFPAEPVNAEYTIDAAGTLHLLDDEGQVYFSLSIEN